MRILYLILPLALAGLLSDDGEKDGRRGNELYEQGSYGPAIEAYRSGLRALDDEAAAWLRYGLENNLGAALLKSGDAAAANEAFSRALVSSPGPSDYARTAYNAGNAAFAAKELEKALSYYRESLLRDPDNHDAKYNYEFVKRQLEQQQQQQQQQQGDQQQDQQQQQNQSGEGEQQQDQQSQRENEQQDGGSEQQQGEQPQDQQPQQPRPQPAETPEKLSEEQAQRILQALQNEEEQLLRQVQRKDARPRKVEKDW